MGIWPTPGLSHKKRLPCIWFIGESFYPPSFISLVRKARNWSILNSGNDIIMRHKSGSIFNSNLRYCQLIMHEWTDWEKAYFPRLSLNGKTILDVGAGCGETALFFFRRGARKVICIEKDQSLLPFLTRNRILNQWNMEIIAEPFKLEHLSLLKFDYAKIDIEGAESALLQLDEINFPLCLEAHDKHLEISFRKRGFETVWKMKKKDVVVMQNFG